MLDAGGIFYLFSSLKILCTILSHLTSSTQQGGLTAVYIYSPFILLQIQFQDNYLNTALIGLLKNFSFRKLRTYYIRRTQEILSETY